MLPKFIFKDVCQEEDAKTETHNNILKLRCPAFKH